MSFMKSASRTDFEPGETINSSFEAQAAAAPDAIALSLGCQSLGYGDLNARANQLAAALRERGVGPDSLVGIHLDRTFDLIIAIMAILKAGGAYLPLDMACPEDRLQFQLTDSNAQIVLTHSSLARRLKDFPGVIICLDTQAAEIARFPQENLPPVSQPHHLAYVIYTSGSTGTPKGVLVTQRNVTRLFSVTESLFGFSPRDVWTLFHSSAFDFSVWEIFGALLYGGRLVIVPYLISRSATAFRSLLAAERVTVLNQTPSAFRQLIQADRLVDPMDCPLRYVIFGGEALDFETLRPWFDRYGDSRPQLVNMYGITETTVHVTYRPVTLADLSRPGSNIGKPLADLQVHLVNAEGKPVEPGQPGEMLVGGPGVARGYLNRPDLTHQRFIPDPSGRPGALYRSGDLARERENGELDYLGRIDQQVKIRGFRIELSEIESTLAQHPAVAECAVLSRTDGAEEPRLVGYIVPNAGAQPEIEPLRAHLARTLPDYMVPAAFVFLPSFPLTLNGKLDRTALPAPGTQRPHLSAGYIAPRDDLEKTVALLWQSLLGLDTVGADDNFFDLGGNSLLLTQMHRQLETGLNRPIPITDLFQFSTIRRLAAHLAQEKTPAFAVQAQDRAQRQREALLRARRPSVKKREEPLSTPSQPPA
jgi:amino acid adenylation domain-containing protein